RTRNARGRMSLLATRLNRRGTEECFSQRTRSRPGSSMARKRSRDAFRPLAKRILEEYREFHPTQAASSGLHRFDGQLADYTIASVRRYVASARKALQALDRIEQGNGLSRAARLDLGVLRGLLLSEISELEDQRLPQAFPPHHLFRLSVVNYLLRNYAPLDRRLRAVARLQAQIPRYLKDLRATTARRLADPFYELEE